MGIFKRLSVEDFSALPEQLEVVEGRFTTDKDYREAVAFLHEECDEDGGCSLVFDEAKFVQSKQYRNAVNIIVYGNKFGSELVLKWQKMKSDSGVLVWCSKRGWSWGAATRPWKM